MNSSVRNSADELASIKNELNQLEKDIRAEAGQPLVDLDEKIKQLTPKAQPAGKQPEFGYHSQIAGKQDTVKWVEVDLGKPTELQQIVLHPCHDDYAGIGAGFGFPVRFHIEVDDSPRPAGNADSEASGARSATGRHRQR